MEECQSISGFPGIVSVLRFFAEAGRFTVIDKFGGALSPSVVRDALYDALRVAASLRQRKQVLTISTVTRTGEEKEYRVECCDYTEISSPAECGLGICGRVVEGPENLRGKLVNCARCPLEPSKDELEKFLHCINQPKFFVDLTRSLAAAAFTRPTKEA